jgi:alkylhydroperoxidase family enzyme
MRIGIGRGSFVTVLLFSLAMARVKTIAPTVAEGELADVYARVSKTRGQIANILQVQSLNPQALGTHLDLYRAIVFAPSPLSRAEREAVAVAVSATNGCEY